MSDVIFKSKYDEKFQKVMFWDSNSASEREQVRSIRSIIEGPASLYKEDVLDAMRLVCIDAMKLLDEHEFSKKFSDNFYKKENPRS